MSIFYGLYVILSGSLFLFFFPFFWLYTRVTGRYSEHLEERLGILSSLVFQRLKGTPRIWIHAVSLGEVKVAASIIESMKRRMPGCAVTLSTVTEHGRQLAKDTFGEDIPLFYAPIDFVGSVRKALSTVRPDIIIFLETELWPAWLFEARRMGIKTILVNGRISARSIPKYLKLRPFFRDVLENFDSLSMISEKDADRIIAMGADPEKISICGNAKYDLLGKIAEPSIEVEMRRMLNLEKSQRVFVAGSTREGEEIMILDAYEKILKKFPDTILLIAPRHIVRTPKIISLIKERGFTYQLRTDFNRPGTTRTERVVIINSFGELFNIFSIATIVFCGASLVPLGGQNPLEAAVWGKVIFYGPFMENFLDARMLLEKAGGGVQVSSPESLAEKAIWFFNHPEDLESYGRKARDAVMNNLGTGDKHAQEIEHVLTGEAVSQT